MLVPKIIKKQTVLARVIAKMSGIHFFKNQCMQVAKVSRSIIGQQQVNSKDKVHQQQQQQRPFNGL